MSSTVITKDGRVHLSYDGPEGPTTECGLEERAFLTETTLRVTCWECLNTVICPKCDQRVEVEVLHGRVREVRTTKVHIAKGRVCHAILNTKETR